MKTLSKLIAVLLVAGVGYAAGHIAAENEKGNGLVTMTAGDDGHGVGNGLAALVCGTGGTEGHGLVNDTYSFHEGGTGSSGGIVSNDSAGGEHGNG